MWDIDRRVEEIVRKKLEREAIQKARKESIMKWLLLDIAVYPNGGSIPERVERLLKIRDFARRLPESLREARIRAETGYFIEGFDIGDFLKNYYSKN